MPFLQAGFNARARDTKIRGFTRHARAPRQKVMAAELHRFACGDYFWLDARDPARFLSWGECVVIGSHEAFRLRSDLPKSRLP